MDFLRVNVEIKYIPDMIRKIQTYASQTVKYLGGVQWRRFIFLFALVLCCINIGLSQSSTENSLTKNQAKNLLQKEFALLLSPESNGIVGNFATLDLTKPQASFAGTIVFDCGSLLGIKAEGSVTDGLLPIFSQSQLNSNVGFEVQYSFLSLGKRSIIYYDKDYRKYQSEIQKIEAEYELNKVEVKLRKDTVDIRIKMMEIDKKAEKLQKELTKLEGLIRLERDQKKLDSLRLLSNAATINIEKYRKQQELLNDKLRNLPSSRQIERDLKNNMNRKKKEAFKKMKVYGFSFGWFTFGYGLQNSSFRLFDPSLAFENQVQAEDFTIHTLRANYSYYHKRPYSFASFFFSLGTVWSLDHNLGSLSSVKITEIQSHGPQENDRTSTKSYTAYQGQYKDNLRSLTIRPELYYFLFEDNKAALHIYPEQTISDAFAPVSSLGFGFLVGFKNSKKTSTIINAEVYADLIDLSNSRNSNDALLRRSSYGLRFTFPINFNQTKRSDD